MERRHPAHHGGPRTLRSESGWRSTRLRAGKGPAAGTAVSVILRIKCKRFARLSSASKTREGKIRWNPAEQSRNQMNCHKEAQTSTRIQTADDTDGRRWKLKRRARS